MAKQIRAQWTWLEKRAAKMLGWTKEQLLLWLAEEARLVAAVSLQAMEQRSALHALHACARQALKGDLPGLNGAGWACQRERLEKAVLEQERAAEGLKRFRDAKRGRRVRRALVEAAKQHFEETRAKVAAEVDAAEECFELTREGREALRGEQVACSRESSAQVPLEF